MASVAPTQCVPDQRRMQTIRDGLFFIVGPHRAGTTLLQAMLSSHSALTIPPESGYFDQVWPRCEALGSLSDVANQARVGHFLNGPDSSTSDLGLDWSQVLDALSQTSHGYDDLFVVMMTLYADSRQKRRAGEKSPRHLFAAREILNLYPQAKFLCLIRDPRAVVRSERATSWGSRSVCRITHRWCRVVDEAARLERELSAEQFQIVRYENLVADPETTLRAICTFLGESFEPQMLQFYERPESERGFRADEAWKQNTLQAVDATRADLWQRDLSVEQITLIERIAGPRMGQQGYAASRASVSALRRLSTWISDHLYWGREVLVGSLKGRSRRRPWMSVWKDLWRRS